MTRTVRLFLTLVFFSACGPGVRLGDPPPDLGVTRDMTTPIDTGNRTDTGVPPEDMGTPPADSSTADGGTADSGTPIPTCTERAQFECQRLFDCSADVGRRRWNTTSSDSDNMTTCVSRTREACEAARAIPDTNGIDYAACDAAYMNGSTVDCERLLDPSRIPGACWGRPGNRLDLDRCCADAQCSDVMPDAVFVRGRCVITESGGTCGPLRPENSFCSEQNCDRTRALTCVRTWTSGMTMPNTRRECLSPAEGAVGAACAPNSVRQCAPGLYCNNDPGTCQVRGAAGATCRTDDECNGNRLLRCVDSRCTLESTARVGSSCATSPCSDQAYCNPSQICVARPGVGEACAATTPVVPCRAGLICNLTSMRCETPALRCGRT